MPDTIADRIRAEREAKGWSVSELGRRLEEHGVKSGRRVVQRYETGDVIPSVRVLEPFALALGVPISRLDPSGSASKGAGRRPKSHAVDNSTVLGRIPYSSQSQRKGSTMRELLRRLEGALSIVPVDQQEDFITDVQDLAADRRRRARKEAPGAMPGKQKAVAGKG